MRATSVDDASDRERTRRAISEGEPVAAAAGAFAVRRRGGAAVGAPVRVDPSEVEPVPCAKGGSDSENFVWSRGFETEDRKSDRTIVERDPEERENRLERRSRIELNGAT